MWRRKKNREGDEVDRDEDQGRGGGVRTWGITSSLFFRLLPSVASRRLSLSPSLSSLSVVLDVLVVVVVVAVVFVVVVVVSVRTRGRARLP